MERHLMCSHPPQSVEAKEQFLETTKDMTDRQLIEGFKTDKAELLQNWMGKDDFFYCHS